MKIWVFLFVGLVVVFPLGVFSLSTDLPEDAGFNAEISPGWDSDGDIVFPETDFLEETENSDYCDESPAIATYCPVDECTGFVKDESVLVGAAPALGSYPGSRHDRAYWCRSGRIGLISSEESKKIMGLYCRICLTDK